MLRSIFIAIFIVIGLLLYSYSDLLMIRLATLTGSVVSGNPRIAVVHPTALADDFLKGAQIAADMANAGGGLFGRPVELVPIPEPQLNQLGNTEADVQQSLAIARRIVLDPSVIAVIGHATSRKAITASPLYNQANKLFLAPYATGVSLVHHRLDTVFAMLPNNRVMAYVLARYAVSQGQKRIVLLSDDSTYGRDTSLYFAVFAEKFGIDIVYRDAFRPVRKSVEDILTFMLDNTSFKMDSVDSIVVIADGPNTGNFIRITRLLGINLPIMGTDAMNDPEVATIAGASMRNVVGVTVVDPSRPTEIGQRFVDQFRARHGGTPSLWAVLGHDAVHLTVESARRTGGTNPSAMADLLRIMRFNTPIAGASGTFGFTREGEVIGKPAFVIRHDGQRFEFVERFDQLPRLDEEDMPSSAVSPHVPTILPAK